MCNTKIKNMRKVILFTDSEVTDFVNRVYHGKISEDLLCEDLYFKSANALISYVEKGFGSKKSDLDKSTKEWNLLADLIQSVYPFSAAKQYQCVKEISEGITEEKDTSIENGIKVFRKYYVDYFSAELDSVEYQAIAAKKWQKFTTDGEEER